MKKIIITILILCLTLAGCKQTEESNVQSQVQQTATQTEILDTEGNLTFSIRQPKTLNPLKNEDHTVDNLLNLIFEDLFTLDQNLKPIPNLASDYSISEDGKQLTVSLRNDIFWSDGTLITLQDVIYSLDTIRATPTSIYYNNLEYIQNYSISNNKIIINYKEPYSFSLYDLCIPIIPKHYYTKAEEESTQNLHVLGSGMFILEEYDVVKKLVFKKTSNFKGTPKINTITAIISTDKETDFSSFEQNITNFIPITLSDLGKINSNKEIKIQKVISNNFEFLGFNLKNKKLSDINIRKAIAHLIPKQEILNNIYLGNGSIANTIVNSNSWLYSPNVLDYEYNQQEAISYLNKAKSFTKEDSLTILVNEENNERIETAEIIANRLNQVGILTEINKLPFNEYKEKLEKDDFELFIGGIDFSAIPDYKSFLTSFGMGQGGINYNNISDSYMNDLVQTVYSAVNEEELKLAMENLQKYTNEYLGFVGILFKDYILLTDENIKITIGSRYDYFGDIINWYITKK